MGVNKCQKTKLPKLRRLQEGGKLKPRKTLWPAVSVKATEGFSESGPGPDIADVLRKFFEVLDARYSFWSTRNSEYAAESLDWVLKDQGSAAERLLSNFDLGEFFGDVTCRYGHKTRLFNIDRGHYVACDTCRTYIFVGSNLFSCWRQENKDIWQKNFDSVKGYKFIR